MRTNSSVWTIVLFTFMAALLGACGDMEVKHTQTVGKDFSEEALKEPSSPSGAGGEADPTRPSSEWNGEVDRNGADPRTSRDALGATECPVELLSCTADADCASAFGEEGVGVCTQGGHCVDPTGVCSATVALQADLDALPPAVGLGVPYALPPNARLRLDDPDPTDGNAVLLQVRDRIIFDGRGSAFTVYTEGLETPQTTVLRIGPNGLGGRPNWSSVRDLTVIGGFNSNSVDEITDGVTTDQVIAVDVQAHGVRLDNIMAQWVGTVVRADGNAVTDYENLNAQQWSRIVGLEIAGIAIDIDGGDSQAGLISGVEVIGSASPNASGIVDTSGLGNTYIAPTIENSGDKSLHFDARRGAEGAEPTNYSTVIGGYVESRAIASKPNALNRTTHVGGNVIPQLEGKGDRVGYGFSKLTFREEGLIVTIPESRNMPMSWRHPEEAVTWRFEYFAGDNPYWTISHGTGSDFPLSWAADGNANWETGTIRTARGMELCGDDNDNDGDGWVSCEDPDCFGHGACSL